MVRVNSLSRSGRGLTVPDRTVNVEVPAAGVPLRTPVEAASVNPAGSDPGENRPSVGRDSGGSECLDKRYPPCPEEVSKLS